MRSPVELDVAEEPIARSVLALQREAYAVEAGLIGSDGIPALTETLDGLRAANETWLGLVDDAGLAGAVSWREQSDGTVDIHRLVVAPRAFRRGVATTLLDALDERYPERRMVVSTGRENAPARELYRRRGFVLLREREVVPGLWIAELGRSAGGRRAPGAVNPR